MERYAALDLFDGDGIGASVDEINALASSDSHGWEPVVAYEDNANAMVRVVVSFDTEHDRLEFGVRYGCVEPEQNDVHPDQMALLDVPAVTPTDAELEETHEWVGLPDFVPVPKRLSRTFEFPDEAGRDAFFAQVGIKTIHKGTRGTLSVWWPDRPKEDLSSLRFVDTGLTRPRYPVYVISKGRASPTQALTARFLLRDRVPFALVVEPQEVRAYRRAFPQAVILELPFSNLGQGSTPARNFCWENARELGYDRHWILDDNIGQIRRLYAGRRIPCDAGPALAAAEDFIDRHDNLAIGGLNYQMFVTPVSPPFARNVHVYSALLIQNDLPYRWRLRYNEDTDLCLQVLADGLATVLVSAFMIDKKTTMTMSGGNTDQLYAGDGRTKMARSLRALWPEYVTVRRRFGRDQHVVAWDAFQTALQPISTPSAAQGERGLTLRKIQEPQAPTIRRLFDDYHRRNHGTG
jgi:hypothetical protein